MLSHFKNSKEISIPDISFTAVFSAVGTAISCAVIAATSGPEAIGVSPFIALEGHTIGITSAVIIARLHGAKFVYH